MKNLFLLKKSHSTGKKLKSIVFIFLLFCMIGLMNAQTLPSIEWLRQFGTTSAEISRGVIGGDNIYLAGSTFGTFPGQTNYGPSDGFLAKYDPSGNSQWVSQYGTAGAEAGYSVTMDLSGVYSVGVINGGTFPGQTNYGSQDLYIRKNDHMGNELWTQQFGTAGIETTPEDIIIDATGIYTAAQTNGALPGFINAGLTDFFILKYSPDGNYLWNRQIGTEGYDNCYGLYVDNTGLYICGSSSGNLSGELNNGMSDAFIAKYTPDGEPVWTRLFGTNMGETAYEIHGNASGLFVSGNTGGTFPGQSNAGGSDAFIAKYDRDGNQLWVKQFGTSGTDNCYGISANNSGAYVVGNTNGTFPGQVTAIGLDIYTAGFNNNGDQLWLMQIGAAYRPGSITVPNDYGYAVSVVSLKAYFTGYTNGVLPDQTSSGGSDAFVMELLIQTPQEATQDLITSVGQLVASGVLNPGQGNALIVKLQAAIQKMNQGNYNAAINNLNAFINQVIAFNNAGIFTDEEAHALIVPVERIIEELEELLLKTGGATASVDPSTADPLRSWNYPNPFNTSTMIGYSLPDDLHVILKLFDSQGKEVRTLVDGMQSKGNQSIILTADGLPGGIYYYRLQAGSSSVTNKLVVLK